MSSGRCQVLTSSLPPTPWDPQILGTPLWFSLGEPDYLLETSSGCGLGGGRGCGVLTRGSSSGKDEGWMGGRGGSSLTPHRPSLLSTRPCQSLSASQS